ncbi:hypothetical protein QTP88_016335 [Uroleucon formosanum]
MKVFIALIIYLDVSSGRYKVLNRTRVYIVLYKDKFSSVVLNSSSSSRTNNKYSIPAATFERAHANTSVANSGYRGETVDNSTLDVFNTSSVSSESRSNCLKFSLKSIESVGSNHFRKRILLVVGIDIAPVQCNDVPAKRNLKNY